MPAVAFAAGTPCHLATSLKDDNFKYDDTWMYSFKGVESEKIEKTIAFLTNTQLAKIAEIRFVIDDADDSYWFFSFAADGCFVHYRGFDAQTAYRIFDIAGVATPFGSTFRAPPIPDDPPISPSL